MVTHGHLAQTATIVDVVVRRAAIGALSSQAVRIVREAPGGATLRQGCQLSAVLPGVGTSAVAERIADIVVRDRLTVIGFQQVAPVGISVDIADCVGGGAQRFGGVTILCAAENVTRIIVCPNVDIIRSLIILPDQLVGLVVGVVGGFAAADDLRDIAVGIIGSLVVSPNSW